MIKNKRQLAVTRKQRDLLVRGLANAREEDSGDILMRAHMEALEYDIAKLDREIEQYLDAIDGRFDFGKIEGLKALGGNLVLARIALGLTQAELAERVGCKEQQIQRYESDQYATASLDTLVWIAGKLKPGSIRQKGASISAKAA